MNKVLFFLVTFSLVLASCSGESSQETEENEKDMTKESLRAEIESIEDSLVAAIPQVPKDLYDLAISRNLQYFDHFPEDEYSAACLDRVQGYYSQLQRLKQAVAYTDILLENFPDYKNKKFLMYNRATSLDMLRDTARARKAYVEYLETFPNLSKDEKEEIEELIKLVPYSIEERILMYND